TRVDERFRHRLPRVEVDADGQKWAIVEGQRPVRVRDLKLEGEDLERSKAGSRDPEERIRDHERDGIDAEVIYPNRGLMMWASPEPQFQTEMCRVWNDWAIETFGGYLHRMAPVAAIAPAEVSAAVDEVYRVAKMGYRTLFLPVQPNAASNDRRIGYHLPMFDPLWSAIEDTGMPVSFHVGTGKDPRTATGDGGAVINYVVHALSAAIEPVVQLCASGALERHPKMRFATVEAGIGWLAWTLWAADEAYQKHHMFAYPKLQMLPSEYWRRQGYATFQDDPIGIQTRNWLGTDRLLWGNDYPHHEGTWPHSSEAIERQMKDLSEDERRRILGLNAAELYGFTVPEEYRPAVSG
ncbi:MAG TPA: amidohydrolase family protein, partial [Tepidiformaceae bacterium]|nr:amidohydrolase family protein [Tepidiformaceae bacterium]